jgi:Flp pilus assembly protein TadD
VPAFRLGRALQAMGAHKAAADQFRRVLELQPGDGEAKRQLANTLISLDDIDSSIRLYQEVIAESGDHRAFNGLGVALDMTGKHKQALAAYRAGLAKAPDDLSLKNNLALSMALAGNYGNAAKVLRSVASDPRANARHRQNLALVYGLAGQETAAARVARVDLDGASVRRNLDYYNWLRQQPRWMVKKLLRNGAPMKPQAASARSKAKPQPKAAAPRKTQSRKASRKPAHATPREGIRPAPRTSETAAGPRRVDQNGVIRQASLAVTGEPPVRFARLEFGFRPVRDAEPPKAAAGEEAKRREPVVARLESRHPVVVQPRISTPMPVVIRGNGETPVTGTAKAAAKPAERPVVTPKATPRKAETANPVERVPVEVVAAKPKTTTIRTQLALVTAARQAEALRRIEARFQHAGLEYIMGKTDPAKE